MKLHCIKALHHEDKQKPWGKNIHPFQALILKGMSAYFKFRPRK
jgi:hypothetical protein